MPNRLGTETSPYLKQHADNPVHWQPWDEAALAQARELDRPILLSIGYASCHWCHVMAHESFEDTGVAAVMNDHFVNIKVDREERPDLDKVYQLAHQLLTQQPGGWPLTVFLDPQTLLPFFAGTYFPKTPRYQLPGFADLLLRISETFSNRRDELTEQGSRVRELLTSLSEGASPGEDGPTVAELLEAAHESLGSQYDAAEGGFGIAPKFPMPAMVGRELRYWALAAPPSARRETLERVMITLTKMARGGIYDHVGGGFFRYATDRKWMIPHFEKMLYDNGQLLTLYSRALAVGPDELFIQAVTDTAGWMLREMRHPEGGFYAALDADSDGREGAFYVWRRDQLKKLLDPTEYLVVETLYGVDKPANFNGRWNLHRFDAWRSVVERLSLTREEADRALASARAKMLDARSERSRPGLDDNVLAGWNGLAMEGLATAGIQLGRDDWISAAGDCADFIRTRMWTGTRLLATWKDDGTGQGAYLDDYANLLAGLLALLAARWREEDAAFALALANTVVAGFEDRDHGGFFFTAHDHESLIYRPKPTLDDALPPGNGTLADALLRLAGLFGKPSLLATARRILDWARPQVARYPAGHCTLLSALELEERGIEQIIIRGPRDALDPWLEVARRGYAPARSCYAIPWEGARTIPEYLPRLVSAEDRAGVVAYRCSGMSCSLPITSPEELARTLEAPG
jgi:uncharacterized protein YyaL (SSP411 family)